LISYILQIFSGLIGKWHNFAKQSFGMNPAKCMAKYIELTGIITDNGQVLGQTVVNDTTDQSAFKETHANHVEANNSAMRRKCSAYRRKTNTYVKSETGLQRVLNVYWVVHNFFRVHFTTKEVPALSV
jgi:IS1 family transposase